MAFRRHYYCQRSHLEPWGSMKGFGGCQRVTIMQARYPQRQSWQRNFAMYIAERWKVLARRRGWMMRTGFGMILAKDMGLHNFRGDGSIHINCKTVFTMM